MKKETKLTSVNILEDVYKKFKVSSVDGTMNLQKLVNRAIDLYNNSDEFKQKINNHTGLTQNGSKY